ncbi:MAG TPA: AAA family ATPase [Anaerolineaceae bacterium]|nr:AAA family ATPase [Anaerolineaceae bacterium]
MSPDGLLTILMLGPPVVRQHEQIVDIPRKQTRGLLFYLAAQSGPVTRDKLIELFFDDEYDLSRRRLSEAITKLRSALPLPAAIITTSDTVELDSRLVYSDVLEFNQLIHADGRSATATARPQLSVASYQRLNRAVNLWRQPAGFLAGARLPDGINLDSWLTQFSQELENDYMMAILQLADHLAATGELQLAIERLQLGLNLAPLDAELNVRKIRCLIQSGNIRQAADYANYVAIQYDEEETYLPHELTEVMQQVFAIEAQPTPELHPNWAGLVQVQNQFIGQEVALEKLKLAYQRGGVVMVMGEAGAGKSRLVYEFVRRLSPPPRQLLALCHPLEQNLEMQPWIDLLRRHVQPSEWQTLDPAWIYPLIGFLPELAILRPELLVDQEKTIGMAPSQLFEALHQILLYLASRQRIVLFMDAAQWSDKLSREAMGYLVERHFFDKNGILILAARPQEGDLTFRGSGSASDPRRNPTIIEMEPLTINEVAQMAWAILGQPASPQLAFRLKMDSGGNPYYLLELLYTLLDLHIDLNGPYLSDKLPSSGSLMALIQARVRQLSPQSREVLEAAAVIGKHFTLDQLKNVARLPLETTAESLETLIQAHLIREMPEIRPAGGYGFEHDKTQEAVWQGLLRPRRQVLHRRLAQALESEAGSQSGNLQLLAHHWEEAGDLKRAFNYWFEHGTQAVTISQWEMAKAAFKQAERLMEQIDSDLSDDQVYQLLHGWAGTYFYTMDVDQLRQVCQKMLRAGERRSSARMMGAALRLTADADTITHQPAQGLVNIERAMTYLEPLQDVYELVAAQSCRGLCLWQLGRYPEAVAAWTLSASLSVNEPAVSARAAGLFARIRLATAHVRMGWPRKAEQEARSLIHDSMELHRSVPTLFGRSILSASLDRMGQHYMAIEIARAAQAAAQDSHNLGLIGNLLFITASAQIQLGKLDEAWDTISQLLREINQVEFVDILKLTNQQRGDIFRLLEDYPAAVKYYQEGLGSTLDGIYTMENLLNLGVALLLQGHSDLGNHFLDRIIAESQAQELCIFKIEAELALAYQHTLAGDHETAAHYMAAATESLSERGLVVMPITPDQIRALLALQQGDLDTVQAIGNAAISRGIESKNPWVHLRGLELCCAASLGVDRPRWRAEIKSLLRQLETQAQHPELRPAFLKFQDRVLERTQ